MLIGLTRRIGLEGVYFAVAFPGNDENVLPNRDIVGRLIGVDAEFLRHMFGAYKQFGTSETIAEAGDLGNLALKVVQRVPFMLRSEDEGFRAFGFHIAGYVSPDSEEVNDFNKFLIESARRIRGE